MIKVLKRDGRLVRFDSERIVNAVRKAAEEVNELISNKELADIVVNTRDSFSWQVSESGIPIERIQDSVEEILKKKGFEKTYRAYHEYRINRTKERQRKSELMQAIHKIGIETDRDNANVGNNFSAKLLRIASETNKAYNLSIIPKHLSKLHENGDIYTHDLDSYNLTTNCLHVPTGKLLHNGFNTGYGTIKQPKRIEVAAELSCIMLQSSQNK